MECRLFRAGGAVSLMAILLFLGVSLLEQQTQAQGTVLHVAPAGDCGGMPNCYAQPQDAVDAASEGDIIKMASGLYTGVRARSTPPGYPNPPPSGVITQVLFINKTVALSGGYTTTDWVKADPIANLTTLDALGEGRVLCIAGAHSPTIEGVRITGGDAVGLGGGWGTYDAGGGIYVITATAAINDNQVSNSTAGSGGGLYLHSGDGTLSDNTVSHNSAEHGGGIQLYDSNATLSRNSVFSNTANATGGGVHMLYGTAALIGNSIYSNTAGTWGGGLDVAIGEATLSGNTILSNAAKYGGGLYLGGGRHTFMRNTVTSNAALHGGGLYLSGHPVLVNSVVADNEVDGLGSGLYIGGSSSRLIHCTIARNVGGIGSGVYVTDEYYHSTVTLTNTILVSHTVGITVTEGNTATLEGTLWYGNSQDTGGSGAITMGTVNTYGYPDFVDPSAADYHIGRISAAVDGGVKAGVDRDIDNEPRLEVPDVGADEYWAPGALKHLYLPVALRSGHGQ